MRARPGPWLSRWRRLDPRLLDAMLALLLLLISVIDIWSARSGQDRAAATLIVAALAAGVAVRRRWLLQAMAVLVVIWVGKIVIAGWAVHAGPSGLEGSLMGLLLFYGAGAYLTGPRTIVGLGLGIVLISVSAISQQQQVVANLLWDDAVLACLPWFVGRMMRSRSIRARVSRQRAERIDSEREMHGRVAALAERARLAREIHDVIAHSVSVMVIQAAGARSVMDRDPLRAQQALGSVERAGREALAEMRRLLGVLGDRDELRALAPQPGLEDLGELLAHTRAAGLAASMTVYGEPVVVPPGLGLCAYRLVQEALTNTIKHAGAARAEVRIRWCGDAIEIEVADDGGGLGLAPARDGTGHGIVGMRERAALHGGRIETGPLPDGGFAVRARIPLAEAVAA